ncbi:DUF3572 domain-containing protein [Microvirga pudoricolor]|uniref:DUF3572 domain-containing protein n=1 Tax=Microvirga pudoricolor TaxID=2778729 RepID=UPI00195177F6|nr:DUF3572 domain-containing protein [Microvirga pudoricolor]MBM6594198.1 DUF3572 domain-containing protein [Microvirga pudoricolor]
MPLHKITPDQAQTVALQVFTALSSHGGRLARFMNISGLTPETIRDAAQEPGFLAGILDYVASDEALLLELSKEMDTKPEQIMEARATLSPSEFE